MAGMIRETGIRETGNGVLMEVRVKPNSKKFGSFGVHNLIFTRRILNS